MCVCVSFIVFFSRSACQYIGRIKESVRAKKERGTVTKIGEKNEKNLFIDNQPPNAEYSLFDGLQLTRDDNDL